MKWLCLFLLLLTCSLLAQTVNPTLPAGISCTRDSSNRITGCTGTVFNTDYPATCNGAVTHTPANGAALASLLTTQADNAGPLHHGDVIQLTHGTQYSAPSSKGFILPVITGPNTNNCVTVITTDAAALLPPPASGTSIGGRVGPSDAVNMAQIATFHSTDIYENAIRASGGIADQTQWRLVGLEIVPDSAANCSYRNVRGGYTLQPNCLTYAALVLINGASHLTFDRVWIHGYDGCISQANDSTWTPQDICDPTGSNPGHRQDVNYGIQVTSGSGYISVLNSRISNLHGGMESKAFMASSGTPGPFKLNNNFLSAAGETWFFGSGAPNKAINTIDPANVEIVGNHNWNDPQWYIMTNIPVTHKVNWILKNLGECKDVSQVLIRGNVLENAWSCGQGRISSTGQPIGDGACQAGGEGLRWTVRTSPSGPDASCNDATIDSNLIANTNFGITFGGFDNLCATTVGCTGTGAENRVQFSNNVVVLRNYDTEAGANGTYAANNGIQQGQAIQNINTRHNDILVQGSIGYTYGVAYYYSDTTEGANDQYVIDVDGNGKSLGGANWTNGDTFSLPASLCPAKGANLGVGKAAGVSGGVMTTITWTTYPDCQGNGRVVPQVTNNTTTGVTVLSCARQTCTQPTIIYQASGIAAHAGRYNNYLQNNLMFASYKGGGGSFPIGNSEGDPGSPPVSMRFNGNVYYICSACNYPLDIYGAQDKTTTNIGDIGVISGYDYSLQASDGSAYNGTLDFTPTSPYTNTVDGLPAGVDNGILTQAIATAWSGTAQ